MSFYSHVNCNNGTVTAYKELTTLKKSTYATKQVSTKHCKKTD